MTHRPARRHRRLHAHVLMSLLLGGLTLLAGCSSTPETVCETPEGTGCDDCYEGEVTCTFDGVSATAGSCGGCQARLALHDELCEQGFVNLRTEVEEAMVCELEEPAEE